VSGLSDQLVQTLLSSLTKCEVLVKLVLKDIPLSKDSNGSKLAKCIQNLYKLENLQLINCNLSARSLLLIAKELEYNIILQNLSLARNVLRKHASNREVVNSLIAMISNNKSLTHLDLSDMFLGDTFITQIVTESVAGSKSLAAFHFSGNNVSEKAKNEIFKIFKAPPRRDTANNLIFDKVNDTSFGSLQQVSRFDD